MSTEIVRTSGALPLALRTAVVGCILLLGVAGGCGHGGRSIPRNVVELDGGRTVSVVAPRPGTVWVYEKEVDQVVYTGPVHQGARITVDAGQHLRIDGAEIKMLNPATDGKKHRYIVYFRS